MTKRSVTLLCSLICTLPLVASPVHSALPGGNPAFYNQVPANLPSLAPGTLIDSQRESEFLKPMKHMRRAKRILYRSTGQTGNPITVSGMVFVPRKPAPAGGWPIVAWGHGTSGVGDDCAPSKHPDMYDNGHWRVYIRQIDELLKEGYVVVATDYEGLGTPGVHSYLMSDALGKATIDGVRATKSMIEKTSNKWAAIGHSEGGQASIAAGELADIYGAGLDYRGAVAYAPASNNMAQLDFAEANPWAIDRYSSPYLAYEAVGMRTLDPNFDYANFVGSIFSSRMADAEEHCWDEWFEVDNRHIQPTLENVVNANWRSDPIVQAYFTAIDNVGKRPAAGPVLILQGEADGLFGVLPLLKADMCAQNTTVHAITYSNVGHDEVIGSGWDDARDWLAQRFAGLSVPTDC